MKAKLGEVVSKNRKSVGIGALAVAFVGLALALPAYAAVVVSSAATQSMVCTGGECVPTNADAVLNVSDLETLLVSGDVTTSTTGSGIEARDVIIEVPISWSTSSGLAIDAHHSIAVEEPVSVEGLSSLSLITKVHGDDEATLAFGPKGHITFANLSSALVIDGATYELVNTIKNLAAAIKAKPSSYFAFADSYNARPDGTYSTSPVLTTFSGVFEGLGNTISNVSIDDPTNTGVGLFAVLDRDKKSTQGQIRDIGVMNANVIAGAKIANVGIVVGFNLGGLIVGSHSTGSVAGTGDISFVGGLVGTGGGNKDSKIAHIARSYSTATVTGGYDAWLGGLVGYNAGQSSIGKSFATGIVVGDTDSEAGGLVGATADNGIWNCYATGRVTTGDWDGESDPAPGAGGLIGYSFKDENKSFVGVSYSTGAPAGGSGSVVGGFVGYGTAEFNDTYWDTTTSGLENGIGGGNAAGLTGLTTVQLQSGLPSGFDPAIWAENPRVNNGFPYLLANPPPK